MQSFAALNQFDFHHTLQECKGLSIVFFSSESCASCAYWRQLLSRYQARHPEVGVFEVDAKLDQALTEEFGVFHLPALFLYANGAFRSEIQCEANMDKLEGAIDEALINPPTELP
jgi:thioredoxin-like negative regulator of GroEL